MGLSKFKSPQKFTSWKDIFNLARENPKLAFGFLGIQLFVVILSYAGKVDLGEAILISLLFTVLWIIIYLILPAVIQFIIGIVVLVAFGALTIFVINQFGGEGLLTLLIALVLAWIILMIILGILYLLIYLVPGIIAYIITAQLTDSEALAVIAFIVVTIVTVLVVTFIFRYLLPFLYRFGWTWVSYGLANSLAVGVAIGMSTRELMDVSARHIPGIIYDLVYLPSHLFSGTPRITRPMLEISDLVMEIIQLARSIFVMPALLGIWAFLVSVAVGIIFLRRTQPKPQIDQRTGAAFRPGNPPTSGNQPLSTPQANFPPQSPQADIQARGQGLLLRGRLYSQRGEYQNAYQCFQEAFDLLASINSPIAGEVLKALEELEKKRGSH